MTLKAMLEQEWGWRLAALKNTAKELATCRKWLRELPDPELPQPDGVSIYSNGEIELRYYVPGAGQDAANSIALHLNVEIAKEWNELLGYHVYKATVNGRRITVRAKPPDSCQIEEYTEPGIVRKYRVKCEEAAP